MRYLVPLLMAIVPLSPGSAFGQAVLPTEQPSASLSGWVRDTAGEPLGNVWVTISLPNDPNRVIRQTTTAADGSFHLSALTPTTVLLVARYPYHNRTTDTVTIAVGRRNSVTVTMRLDWWTLNHIGREPAVSDSTPLVLHFETHPPPENTYCGGVDSISTSSTTITITGFWSSGVLPVVADGRAYRVGSGIVLDIINEAQELVGNATSCLYWRAVLSRLPTALYTLNVRGTSDPRGIASTWLILRQEVDLRTPGHVTVQNPARLDSP